jgi:hypothetical protein
VRLNVPPSQTVSLGPKMMAFHLRTLSVLGEALTPGGGSEFSFLKSLISLFLAGVDMAIKLIIRRVVKKAQFQKTSIDAFTSQKPLSDPLTTCVLPGPEEVDSNLDHYSNKSEETTIGGEGTNVSSIRLAS